MSKRKDNRAWLFGPIYELCGEDSILGAVFRIIVMIGCVFLAYMFGAACFHDIVNAWHSRPL